MAKSQERHVDHQSLTPCPPFIRLATNWTNIFFFLFFLSNQRAPKPKKKGRGQREKPNWMTPLEMGLM
jgi:hypothetical protein